MWVILFLFSLWLKFYFLIQYCSLRFFLPPPKFSSLLIVQPPIYDILTSLSNGFEEGSPIFVVSCLFMQEELTDYFHDSLKRWATANSQLDFSFNEAETNCYHVYTTLFYANLDSFELALIYFVNLFPKQEWTLYSSFNFWLVITTGHSRFRKTFIPNLFSLFSQLHLLFRGID